MKVTYKGKEYEIKYSFRGLMIYENITQKSFQPQTLTDIITLFYSMLIASSNEPIDYNEFIDWLDEFPAELNNFSAFVLGAIQTNEMKAPVKEEDKKEKKTTKKSKN